MFRFAQAIVRHKIGFLAVFATAMFLFARGENDEAAKPTNPWSKQAPVSVAQVGEDDDDSFLSGTVDKAVTAASDYVGEATGVNPMEVKDQTAGNWDKTADAYGKANGN